MSNQQPDANDDRKYLNAETSKTTIEIASFWPEHPRELIFGVNDCWNNYQKLCKGRLVTTAEWKNARAALHAEHQKYLAEGGLPMSICEEEIRFVDPLRSVTTA